MNIFQREYLDQVEAEPTPLVPTVQSVRESLKFIEGDLNESQIRMLEHITDPDNRVVIITAGRRSGKTTVLKEWLAHSIELRPDLVWHAMSHSLTATGTMRKDIADMVGCSRMFEVIGRGSPQVVVYDEVDFFSNKLLDNVIRSVRNPNIEKIVMITTMGYGGNISHLSHLTKSPVFIVGSDYMIQQPITTRIANPNSSWGLAERTPVSAITTSNAMTIVGGALDDALFTGLSATIADINTDYLSMISDIMTYSPPRTDNDTRPE